MLINSFLFLTDFFLVPLFEGKMDCKLRGYSWNVVRERGLKNSLTVVTCCFKSVMVVGRLLNQTEGCKRKIHKRLVGMEE